MEKLVMDAATRKALKGYSILSEAISFTPEIPGVDSEFLPTFELKPLPNETQRKIKFMLLESLEGKKFNEKEKLAKDVFLEKACMESIVGFKNLLDLSTDEFVEWKQEPGKEFINEALFKSLPTMLRVIVLNEVLSLNGLSLR